MDQQNLSAGPFINDLLPPDVWDRLRVAARRERYRDGETIHQRGDIKPGLSIVRAGGVQIGNPGLDGVYMVASVMGPGEFFGEATLFADLPRTHEAVAIGRVEIDQIGRQAFDKLLDQSPALARAMLRLVTSRLYDALEFLDDLQRLPLPVRLAKLLLTAGGGDEVRLNQTDLAERLGVSRVSVGKAISVLKTAKLITPGYGRVQIDRKGLAAYVANRFAVPPLRKLSLRP